MKQFAKNIVPRAKNIDVAIRSIANSTLISDGMPADKAARIVEKNMEGLVVFVRGRLNSYSLSGISGMGGEDISRDQARWHERAFEDLEAYVRESLV